MDLLLASTSPIRGTMLANAGVPYGAVPPDVDEAAMKGVHQGSDGELAAALSAAKALSVSATRKDALVIGSDSLLSVNGRRFSKPSGRQEAAEHLRCFSGQTMSLTSAVALVRGGALVWSHVGSATLQVRPLSDAFIRDYLERDWPEISYCVGAFRLEGPGVQLFERIEGDHFTILGMPLLPLLGALREQGILLS